MTITRGATSREEFEDALNSFSIDLEKIIKDVEEKGYQVQDIKFMSHPDNPRLYSACIIITKEKIWK